jgi:hypothetical protein
VGQLEVRQLGTGGSTLYPTYKPLFDRWPGNGS